MVESRTLLGKTPLHFTAGNLEFRYSERFLGNPSSTLELLINRGADTEAKTHAGETPLHVAASSGTSYEMAILCSRGADVNAMTESGETPLSLAASTGLGISTLVQYGADVRVRTETGNTKLHAAASPSSLHRSTTSLVNVKILQEYNLDIESTNDVGLTPLHVAVERGGSGRLGLISLLLQRGANINAKTASGDTVLHMAASTKDNPATEPYSRTDQIPMPKTRQRRLQHILQPPMGIESSMGQMSTLVIVGEGRH